MGSAERRNKSRYTGKRRARNQPKHVVNTPEANITHINDEVDLTTVENDDTIGTLKNASEPVNIRTPTVQDTVDPVYVIDDEVPGSSKNNDRG